MPQKDNKNIVKIAVEMENQVSATFAEAARLICALCSQTPQLIELDQERSLKLVIQDLCNAWNVAESSDQYALQFGDRDVSNYITEKNRSEIKNGSILRLTFSPARTAQDIMEKLRYSTGAVRQEALQQLVKLSCDHTFATEFINKQGKDYLAQALEQGSIKSDEGLGHALESFVELMNHGICGWDSVQKEFLGKIANQVNSAGTTPTSDPKILTNSLAILESIVTSSTQLHQLVEAEVTLPNLITHVSQNMHNPEIQQNSIALINALFHKSDLSKRKAIAATLSSKHFRNVILNSVINNVRAGSANNVVGSEMAHQLYVLQSLMFNLWEESVQLRSLSHPNVENDAKEKVTELRKLAFER